MLTGWIASMLAASAAIATENPGFFGVATVKPNGEICLQLRSAEPGRPVAESYQCYGPRHPDFAMIREHVGPIRPGEEKVIRPFR